MGKKVILFDSLLILARAAIREVSPEAADRS